MPLQPGEKLGPYEILAPIGAGGMGEVYKARDTRLDRIVAIKHLKAEHTERFTREARAIAALNHPHICQIYDVGSDYLVMEYVQGEQLKRPLPPDEAVRLAIQIAEALEAAHSKGIIHRDLKPGNILVGTAGVKLLDFGLAKMEDSRPQSDAFSTLTVGLTEAGVVVGTVAYMSPEQAQGQPVDTRSDIFSFGAVLYEVLSGRRAFAGDTAFATMSSIVRDEPSPLQAPAALVRIVRQCLAKQPEQRFQTVTEVRAALEQIPAQRVEPRPSIAVLPFADMSPGKDNEYFSDGLAEEIINALTHVPGLIVIARTSAFAFKGQNTDVRRIAEALGVTNILEGSVRKAGNRIRVTAQLITASDGSHLWSERYDRDVADVFAVQDEIAAAIASALQVKLSTSSRKHIPKLAAYEEFLKARHHVQKWTPESAARGRECLERAIALDAEFALAHSDLGWCFFTLATENKMPPREAAALMSAEARKALEIDPSLPDAHAVMGMVAVLDYEWNEAGQCFRRAMAREPIQPLVRSFHSLFYLAPLGRMSEAGKEIELSLQEDPLNLLFRAVSGWYLLASGRFSEGEAIQRQVLELDENYWLPYVWIGAYRATQGLLAEAIPFAEKAYSLAPWNGFNLGLLAGILERTGDRRRAQGLLEKLGDGTTFGAPGGFIAYHAVREELELAADWFEKAIDQRDTRTPWIFPYLFGDVLTSSPRWRKLAKLMNVPETAS